MERLTANKDVSEMGMYELAHNGCYIRDGVARYRDFENDIDARELTRHLLKDYADGDDAFVDDDDFDEEMIELLMYGTSTMEGLIALFYRNLWAMADLRERLKEYDDLEEQGLLLRLPCKVGDRLYRIDFLGFIISDTVHSIHILRNTAYLEMNYWDKDISLSEVGKTIFLTQAEAEKKLKEMESDCNDKN